MTWMIATIDTRSALQKSGAVKVKVVQSSPSQDMLRQPMADEHRIGTLLLEKDRDLDRAVAAIKQEEQRRADDLLQRYYHQEIDAHMYSSLLKRLVQDGLDARAMAKRLAQEYEMQQHSIHVEQLKQQISAIGQMLDKDRAIKSVDKPVATETQKALDSNVRLTALQRVDNIPLTPDQKLQKGLDEMRGEYRTAVRGYVREICYGEIHDTDYGDYEIMLHIEDRLYGLLEEPLWTITQRNMIQTTIDECSELEDKEWERYRKYG